ncbi:MAG: 16S rRNA (guanine(527)-N(7))-methyltransferase RsmG [Smithella sp.]|nr:16S rRNA (guanine(527)-N(7))-methyltransferase RsmG [Smithella sp.]
MEMEMILLGKHAKSLGIDLNHRQLSQFAIYKNELLDWNARTNLISENSAGEIMTRHFLDSLTALPFITQPQAMIIDVGSGAGFPGLPLKIARPDLKIYLLEANRKKVSFLKHMIRLLRLEATYVLHERVENILKADLWKEKFEILISRATFKMDELLTLGDFFLAPAGQLIAWKGPSVEQELSQCLKTNHQHKISQLIQHDIKADFLAAPLKIIIGKN